MRSPVVTVEEGMKTNNQKKTKIGVGYVVKSKVGYLEEITREGRIRRMKKEVVGCVQAVVGKNKFLVLFKYGQRVMSKIYEKSNIFTIILDLCVRREIQFT